MAYDSAGDLIGLFDREGDGPTELGGPARIWRASDDSTILATEGAEITAFDRDLNILGSMRSDLPLVGDLVALSSSGFALEHALNLPDGSYWVVLLNEAGALERPIVRMTRPQTVGVILAPSARGGFWAFGRADLDLVEYSAQGEQLRVVRVASDWFPPWEERDPNVHPSNPRHRGFSDLGDGTAILLTWDAEEGWTRPPTVNPFQTDWDSRYDSILQHVDLATGAIIADRRVDEALRPVNGWCSNGLFYSTNTSELGHVLTQLWDVATPGNESSRGNRPGVPCSR